MKNVFKQGPRPAHGKFRFVVSNAKPACWTDPAGLSREGGAVASRLA
jgi:hypothetical protein